MVSKLRRFLAELQRRKVTRVAVAYAVVGAGVGEGSQMVVEALALPIGAWRAIVIFILLGFPVALVLAWVLELGPEGVRVTPDEPAVEAASRGGWLAAGGWALAAVLLLVTAWQALASDDATSVALAAVAGVEDAMARSGWIDAYRLAHELPRQVPDSTRVALLAAVSLPKALTSEPSGATVSWRPYDAPDESWEAIGTTPVEWTAPRAPVALLLELEGYAPRTVAIGLAPWVPPTPVDATLRPVDGPEPLALHMPGGVRPPGLADSRFAEAAPIPIPPHLIDRYEVTNREFQTFVDGGGYERAELWAGTLASEEGELDWTDGVARFVDRTGRPGPSTWIGGTYPEGTGEHPVTGVSWYEAAAYARFVGRELPTLYHWYATSHANATEWIVPHSNFAGEGKAPVGAYPAVTPGGAYDMAGNAREWVANPDGDLRYLLGGAWNDRPDMFNYAQAQPPWDRSETNGFRLITPLGDPDTFAALAGPVRTIERDFREATPVSDEVFAALEALYAYEPGPLDARIEAIDTTDIGVRETITFDAGYGGERMILYLFRPRAAGGPLQTVVYAPAGIAGNVGLDAFMASDSHVSYLVRSGRAVALPAYKGMLERRVSGSLTQNDSNGYRDLLLMMRQDLGRTLDYLETRPDLDGRRFAYVGVSWGGARGPIFLATEPRLDAAVLNTPGLYPTPVQPVADIVNFLPHVDIPVLVLSGEYDQVYPLETSARPFFDLLGTDETHKRHFIAPGGHSVPMIDATRETLDWLDRYMGEPSG